MPPKELWEAYDNRTVHPVVSVRLYCFMSGAYLIYSLREEPQIQCLDSSWDGGVYYTIFAHCDFDIDI